MSRLAVEYRRLFLSDGLPPPVDGPVRALVLGVSQPAAWQPLGAVWSGVQLDLGLPAPAIAVDGTDGLQLWFSLARAVEAAQGRALLEGLRQRYLADLPAHRVVMQAVPVPVAVPRPIDGSGVWSAFVAADLAPLFEDTPWLDTPPSEGGQAELLSRVASIAPAAWQSALRKLRGPAQPAEGATAQPGPQAPGQDAARSAATQFLMRVMQDEAAPLALRVDAAKALLSGAASCRPED